MKSRSKCLLGVSYFVLGMMSLTAAAHGAEAVIDQKGLKFVPNSVAINAGDSIRFKNNDPFTHNVTVLSANGARSDKGLQHHGQDMVVAFPDKGTFSIVCTMHPNMKATVVVR